jgi:CRP/FNR family transcriptional regulator
MEPLLSRINLFKGLSDEELSLLDERSEHRELKKYEIIYEKGGSPSHLYLLKSGKVKIYDERKITQREEIIHVFSQGDVFDIPSVLIQKPFPLSAQSLEDSQVISFPQKIIQDLFHKSSVFPRNCAAFLSRLNSQLIEEVSDLSLSTTKERLAKYLLREFKQQRRPASFRLPLNQSQIASHLGTVREIVSRDLASLKKARVIESNQGEIAVLNPQELSQIAEGYSFHQ